MHYTLFFIFVMTFFAAFSVQARSPDLYFYPEVEWQLSESFGADGQELCLAATELNNGFILQFDGTATGITNIRMDFRQAAFEPGAHYTVELSTTNQNVRSLQAHSAQAEQLDISVDNFQNFFNAMLSNSVFDLKLGDQFFRIYLSGFQNIAAAFYGCIGHSLPGTTTTPLEEIEVATVPLVEPVTNSGSESQPPEMPHINAALPISGSKYDALDLQTQTSTETTNALLAAKVGPSDFQAKKTPSRSPDVVVNHEKYSATVDFTQTRIQGIGEKTSQQTFPRTEFTNAGDEGARIAKLKNEIQSLHAQNISLENQLNAMRKDVEQERLAKSSDNWDLAKATMRFNEAERQVQRLAQQIKKQQAVWAVEKAELEELLFDPKLTDQAQIARLAELEAQLEQAQIQLEQQRMAYEGYIAKLGGR